MELLKHLNIKTINPGAYFGQSWTSSSHQSVLESINPTNGKKIAEIASCSMKDFEEVMHRAEQASIRFRLMPAPKRGEIIRQIGLALREHKDHLGSLVSLEMGKSKQEGDGEVQEMIDMADFAVGQSRMLYGKSMHSERPKHRMYEHWQPYGIVGIITAFNFPVAVWAWNAFLAAVCGNVSIWKPSSKTPLSAIAVQKICNEVLKRNQAPEIFSLIIPGSKDIVDAMVEDKRIRLLSFTGSTAVGKEVAVRVAARLGKSLLELGGNNAIIVDESANLALAIPSIVFGAIGTAGQRCTSTRRVFVHHSIYQEVLQGLIDSYKQIRIGDPLDPKNLMGPLIDEAAVLQFKKAIAELKAAGANIAYGGEVLEGPGFFVSPTLVTEVKNDWAIVQKETFAPILYLMSYESLDEVLSYHNDVPQGLSSALFTQNIQAAEYFLSAAGSDCGIANINIGTSGAEIGGAFGGEKESGGGREAGSDAWQAYMRRQTTTINWGDELPLAQGIRFDLC